MRHANSVRRTPRPLKRALAIAFIGLTAYGFSGTGMADAGVLEMTVVEDAAQGRNITRGRYELAVERLQARDAQGLDAVFVKNNLCVAAAGIRDFDAAAAACDAAVEQAQTLLSEADADRAEALTRYVALARSNRGVLHAMRGEHDAARADFVAAAEQAGELSAPEANLALLER